MLSNFHGQVSSIGICLRYTHVQARSDHEGFLEKLNWVQLFSTVCVYLNDLIKGIFDWFFFHETPYAILFEIAVGAWIWYSPTMRCRLFFSLSFIIIIIIIITIIIITISIIIIIIIITIITIIVSSSIFFRY